MTSNFNDEQLEKLQPDDMADDDYWYGLYESMKEDEAVEAAYDKKYGRNV